MLLVFNWKIPGKWQKGNRWRCWPWLRIELLYSTEWFDYYCQQQQKKRKESFSNCNFKITLNQLNWTESSWDRCSIIYDLLFIRRATKVNGRDEQWQCGFISWSSLLISLLSVWVSPAQPKGYHLFHSPYSHLRLSPFVRPNSTTLMQCLMFIHYQIANRCTIQ